MAYYMSTLADIQAQAYRERKGLSTGMPATADASNPKASPHVTFFEKVVLVVGTAAVVAGVYAGAVTRPNKVSLGSETPRKAPIALVATQSVPAASGVSPSGVAFHVPKADTKRNTGIKPKSSTPQ